MLTINDLEIEESLASQIDAFLLSRQINNLSPNTLKQYRFQLTRFIDFCDGTSIKLDSVTADTIRSFTLALQEKGLRPNTVKNTRRALNTFLNWGEMEGLVTNNPAKKVPLPRVPKDLFKPIPDAGVRAILDCLKGKSIYKVRDRAIFYLWLDTGLRIHEVTSLKVGQVDVSSGVLIVRGKGNKERAVFLGSTAMTHYVSYARRRKGRDGEPLWLGKYGPMSRSAMTHWVSRLRQSAGFHFTSHDIRRTFAIMSLRNGADLLSISRQLGHADLSTTQIYLNQDTEDLRLVHARSSPVDCIIKKKETLSSIR